MKNYLFSVIKDLTILSGEMASLSSKRDTRSVAEMKIKSREHSRLIELLRNALSYYKYFGHESDKDFELLSSFVKNSDDRHFDFLCNVTWDSTDDNCDDDISSDEDN